MTWNPKWREEGKEPDYRFSLANERTYLAWIRTSLAILAGGLLLDQLGVTGHRVLSMLLSLTLVASSSILSLLAYFRWKDNEIAMRREAPLPSPIAIPFLTLLAAAAGAVVVFLVAAPK